MPCGPALTFTLAHLSDPHTGPLPTPGWSLPSGDGVRVDSHAGAGYRVPPYYDSMIGKLIVHGATREAAIARMRQALDEMRVEGIATNLALHRQLVRDEGFAAGGVDIHHLERWLRRQPARETGAA